MSTKREQFKQASSEMNDVMSDCERRVLRLRRAREIFESGGRPPQKNTQNQGETNNE